MPTLLYGIDPETNQMNVISADAVEALTMEARKIAWLAGSTWDEIRTRMPTLPADLREAVTDELEIRLDDAWIEFADDDGPVERPTDWFPTNDDHPLFDDDWIELQGSPVNRSWVGLPKEILALGADVGRPGAAYHGIFFTLGDLDAIRAVAESLGLDLVRDDAVVMGCWGSSWR